MHRHENCAARWQATGHVYLPRRPRGSDVLPLGEQDEVRLPLIGTCPVGPPARRRRGVDAKRTQQCHVQHSRVPCACEVHAREDGGERTPDRNRRAREYPPQGGEVCPAPQGWQREVGDHRRLIAAGNRRGQATRACVPQGDIGPDNLHGDVVRAVVAEVAFQRVHEAMRAVANPRVMQVPAVHLRGHGGEPQRAVVDGDGYRRVRRLVIPHPARDICAVGHVLEPREGAMWCEANSSVRGGSHG